MATWEERFTKATYGPATNPTAGPWRTLVSPGEIAPADLIANEVRYLLSQDPILAAVFEDRFDRMAWLAVEDQATFGQLPRCAVYLVRNTNDEMPTSTSVEMTSIFVGTCWAPSVLKPVGDGEATVATVLAHIKRVLRSTGNRDVKVTYNGGEVSLANDHGLGAEGYGPLQDLAGRIFGVVHEIESKYRLHIERSTGRLVVLP